MKWFLSISFLFALCLFTPYETKAQLLVIRIEKPFVSKQLSGVVTDPNGGIMPGVTIQRYSFNWKKLLGSTSTDEKGKFTFLRISEGLYFLRLISSGFQEMEIKVQVVKKSKKKLTIKMELAT